MLILWKGGCSGVNPRAVLGIQASPQAHVSRLESSAPNLQRCLGSPQQWAVVIVHVLVLVPTSSFQQSSMECTV